MKEAIFSAYCVTRAAFRSCLMRGYGNKLWQGGLSTVPKWWMRTSKSWYRRHDRFISNWLLPCWNWQWWIGEVRYWKSDYGDHTWARISRRVRCLIYMDSKWPHMSTSLVHAINNLITNWTIIPTHVPMNTKMFWSMPCWSLFFTQIMPTAKSQWRKEFPIWFFFQFRQLRVFVYNSEPTYMYLETIVHTMDAPRTAMKNIFALF